MLGKSKKENVVEEKDSLLDEEEQRAQEERRADREVKSGNIEQLVITDTQALKPKAVDAEEGEVLIIYPTRFFWREQTKYNSQEKDDVLCFNFAKEEGGEEHVRFHFQITGPVRDALSKWYGRTLEELTGKAIKLEVQEITVSNNKHLVWRPVNPDETERKFDLNF